MKISKSLTGVSGEYFVAAELSRRGYIASLTLRNSKGIDVLVANEEGTKTLGIQVKTNQNSESSWVLSIKNEDYNSDNLIYIFVNLNDVNDMPSYYIVSSKDVAEYIKLNHQNWLASPNKKGGEHKDNPIRKFSDFEGVYHNNWDIIKEKLSVESMVEE